jgi:hypothetical protein
MKLKVGRVFAAVVVLLGMVFTVSAVASSPAYAACTGYCLDGKDPHQTQCDVGAQTVAQAPVTWSGTTYGMVYLRWSQACQTNWALINVYGTGSNPEHLWRAADVFRKSPYAENDFNYYGDGQWIYGNMLYAPGCAKATGVIDISYATAYGTAINAGCNF